MNHRHLVGSILVPLTVSLLALSAAKSALADPPASAAPRATAPEPPRPVYRFDFNVRRPDESGNARPSTYTLHLEENHPGTLSVGSNVPLQVPSASHGAAPRQDVGITLHFNFVALGPSVVLSGNVEISAAEPMTNGVASIRRIRVDGSVPVTPGRPALFASVSDASTHTTYEITVTATRL